MSATAFHNTTRAAVAVGGLGVIAVGAGAWAWGRFGALLVSVCALLIVAALHRWSGDLATHGGHQPPGDLVLLVGDLADRAGLPIPTVVVSAREVPNAYASGRSPSQAVVVVTRGLLGTVGRPELEGALAHELMHIRRRDLRATNAIASLALAATCALGCVRPPASIVTVAAASSLALLGQLALCRRRELAADRDAAVLLGAGEPLARALHVADPSPVPPRRLGRLLSTHPDSSERVRRLRRIPVT